MRYELDHVIYPATIDYTDMQQQLSGKPDASVFFLAGYCTQGGFNRVNIDEDATIEWARLGAQTGDPLCAAWYGILRHNFYLPAAITKSDKDILSQSLPWLESAAKNGHPYAQTLFALVLSNGMGIKKDPQKSLELAKLSVDQGEAFACANLSVYLTGGRGIQTNLDKAYEASMKAAEQGLATGEFQLGNLHAFNFNGRKPDLSAATVFWLKAAHQGHWGAQFKLGELYAQTNPSEAFFWWQKAAQTGLANARLKIAECHTYGKGTERDRGKAFVIYSELLAEKENKSPSICLLGNSDRQKVALALRTIKLGSNRIVDDGKNYLTWPDSELMVLEDDDMRMRLRALAGGQRKILVIR